MTLRRLLQETLRHGRELDDEIAIATESGPQSVWKVELDSRRRGLIIYTTRDLDLAEKVYEVEADTENDSPFGSDTPMINGVSPI